MKKIALQCAKDDVKEGYDFVTLKKSKKEYTAIFKRNGYTIEKALDFKKWNKELDW
ncbi:hypothetical protein HYI18_04125 [Clostridium botulinum]|uniref:hypothetical protein n=1 Tax=Clostridium botulinum TaxID=1491 RepID=UPI001749CD54|nr:hypothetical protein [Clostridium botulinum]MBD5637800.1 hypothetical protein [Clostridium botulinum]